MMWLLPQRYNDVRWLNIDVLCAYMCADDQKKADCVVVALS